jgi:hypothetical protein
VVVAQTKDRVRFEAKLMPHSLTYVPRVLEAQVLKQGFLPKAEEQLAERVMELGLVAQKLLLVWVQVAGAERRERAEELFLVAVAEEVEAQASRSAQVAVELPEQQLRVSRPKVGVRSARELPAHVPASPLLFAQLLSVEALVL